MDGDHEPPRTVRELLEAVHRGDLPVVYATATASMVQLALEDLVELEASLYQVREENAALRDELAQLRHRRTSSRSAMTTNDPHPGAPSPGEVTPGELTPGAYEPTRGGAPDLNGASTGGHGKN